MQKTETTEQWTFTEWKSACMSEPVSVFIVLKQWKQTLFFLLSNTKPAWNACVLVDGEGFKSPVLTDFRQACPIVSFEWEEFSQEVLRALISEYSESIWKITNLLPKAPQFLTVIISCCWSWNIMINHKILVWKWLPLRWKVLHLHVSNWFFFLFLLLNTCQNLEKDTRVRIKCPTKYWDLFVDSYTV